MSELTCPFCGEYQDEPDVPEIGGYHSGNMVCSECNKEFEWQVDVEIEVHFSWDAKRVEQSRPVEIWELPCW